LLIPVVANYSDSCLLSRISQEGNKDFQLDSLVSNICVFMIDGIDRWFSPINSCTLSEVHGITDSTQWQLFVKPLGKYVGFQVSKITRKGSNWIRFIVYTCVKVIR
jgi:hypothetical protein